jgi:hypothetical protein
LVERGISLNLESLQILQTVDADISFCVVTVIELVNRIFRTRQLFFYREWLRSEVSRLSRKTIGFKLTEIRENAGSKK